jgi:PAS domain S-box-containing protein
LVKTIEEWIWEVDASGIYTYVSPRVRDMLGYEPVEVLGKTPFSLMPPEEAGRVADLFGELVVAQKPIPSLENTNIHKDGRLVIVETSGVPFFAPDGTLLGYRGVDRDITERKRAEEALVKQTAELAESNERLRERDRLVAAFDEIGQAMLFSLDLEQLLDVLGKQIVETGIFRSLMIALVDERTHSVEVVGNFKYQNGSIIRDPADLNGIRYDLDDANVTAEVARTGEMQVVVGWDDRYDTRLGRPEQYEGQVAYFVPIKQEDRVLGLLATASLIEEQEEMLVRIEAMHPLLDEIAIALTHARLFEEVQTSEKALRESEEKMRSVLETAPDVIINVDRDGKIVFINQSMSGPEGRYVYDYIPLAYHDTIRNAIEQVFRTGEADSYELVGEADASQGVKIWYASRIGPMKHNGRVVGATIISTDITKRKRTEQALRGSEEKYRHIIENIQDVFYRADLEGNLVMVSPSAAKTLGYDSVEDMLGLNIAKTFYAVREERDEFLKILEKKGVVNGYEITLKKKDGTLVPAWVSTHFYFDKNGNPLGVEGLISDITERKASEDALRNSHEAWKTTFDAMTDWVSLIAPNTHTIINSNKAGEEVTGRPINEIIGNKCYKMVNNSDEPCPDCPLQKVLKSKNREEAEIKVGEDGQWILVTLDPVFDDNKKIVNVVHIVRDTTERKLLESQLVQEQKLASMGQLAAGIAHEINTPIQYVGDNTRFFQGSFTDLFNLLGNYHRLLEASKAGSVPPELVAEMETAVEKADVAFLSEEIPTAIEQSLEGIDRVTTIVQAMRAFSHPGVSEKTPIDLNKAIESTITVARNEWKYAAEMETDFDADLPLVHCLPGEFNQVILNIVLNAAHAIADIVGDGSKGKGIIAIGTRREDDWAEIRISDTGTGIPEAVRSKVFDPFFTTKEVGKGTGQGLAIAHNVVVEKHGGTIGFETEVDKGTTFIIRLPIEDESI